MGFLSFLGLDSKRYSAMSTPVDLGVASPWSDSSSLTPIVLSDIYGVDALNAIPLTRSEAMRAPGVARGRNLIVGRIAEYPLIALNVDGPLEDQPTWLYRTDGALTPYLRITYTVDDLIFYGRALWHVTRGAAGQILDANRVPIEDWRVENGVIQLRVQDDLWYDADENEVILFSHVGEGLLAHAAPTIRGAIDMERAWLGRAKNPIPMLEIHQTDDVELEPEEIRGLVTEWGKARTAENGAVGFTPSNVELIDHGSLQTNLYESGRNAVRTDLGAFFNIPAAMMDASLNQSTLVYETQQGNRSRFFDETIPYWVSAIEAALSQDNVVPRGQRVRFDRSADYAAVVNPTGTPTED